MSRKNIEAGRAFVTAAVRDETQKKLLAIQRRFRRTAATMSQVGASLVRTGATIGVPLAAAIKSASTLEEVMNKFNVVFGESSDRVKAWGDEFAGQVGRSQRQVAEFLASFQDLFIPLGFEPGTAEALSKEVTALGIDLASFNDKADADTLRDLQAALTGSGEVMKKYGVVLSEAAVKQELLNQSIDPRIASNQEKVQARLNIILRGTTAAQGNAIDSADSLANVMKRVRGAAEDVSAAIGKALLPAITPLAKGFGQLLKNTQGLVEENKEIVVALGKVAVVLGTVGGAAFVFSKVITGVSTVLAAYTSSVIAAKAATIGLSKAFTLLLAHPVVAAIAGITAAIAGSIAVVRAYNVEVGELADEFAALARANEQQRRAAAEQLKRLTDLQAKQSKTNTEIAEATRLATELNAAYAGLGLTVDGTTGAIEGLAKAQGELNKQQRDAAIADQQNVIKELEGNLERVRKARLDASRAGPLFNFLNGVDTSALVRQIKDISGELEAARERLTQLQNQTVSAPQEILPVGVPPGPIGPAAPGGGIRPSEFVRGVLDTLGGAFDSAKGEVAERLSDAAAIVGNALEVGDGVSRNLTRGTFNALAAGALARGGPQERMAKGIENVAANTAELVRRDRRRRPGIPVIG